jgi:hypothetical protein
MDKSMSAFALEQTHIPCNLYSQTPAIANLLVGRLLGYLTAVRWDRFDFTVKIDFEGQCCGVEHGPAVGTVTQVTLNITSHFGREPTFEVLAD